MKPHKHRDLIKAWADGAQIQIKRLYKNHINTYAESWSDDPEPTWYEYCDYRIKPREFEEGAFYPVLDVVGDCEVAWYSYGKFFLTGDTRSCSLEDLTWVGDKLDINWPETE